MKSEDNLDPLDGDQFPVDRQTEMSMLLDLFNKKADDKAEVVFRRKLKIESEVFELQNGLKTTIAIEREKIRKVTEDFPQPHDPKFRDFFPALGKIAGWTEEEMKAYHKPRIAPTIIKSSIYNRFPKDVMAHIQSKNPYVKWLTRLHKHYLFLNEEGILLLEKFIDDAITLMQESNTVYEFRKKHAEKFGTGFQPVLYEKYLGLI
ncbi:P63C domain-containing protein [Pedobacter sp. GR22-10]|uniref:P63C domain-containing protein n=1 Tax=Pedobacter sp. GR22-10 TaxID=2994472 RepID=UPI00224859AF|nr:P63C domain-containing protein [Pedobacter sp. GR22-10]MCX2430662.1 P63C domain-containing protein [Pedobacter sp. GR22-10]